jgi:hypothetical protein
VVGFTVGVAVLAFIILMLGVQLKIPGPTACSVNASGMQIRVSLNGNDSGDLSNTVIV